MPRSRNTIYHRNPPPPTQLRQQAGPGLKASDGQNALELQEALAWPRVTVQLAHP